MLRTGAAQEMLCRAPGSQLQQLKAEHIVQCDLRQRRLLTQHARTERTLEPRGSGVVTLGLQSGLLENTGKVGMLQVKYDAKWNIEQ